MGVHRWAGSPAGPGRVALAGGEGFPEEVFTGGLAVPLRELGQSPQRCPLFLQLALFFKVRGGHVHALQQPCQHLQYGIFPQFGLLLWAESRGR